MFCLGQFLFFGKLLQVLMDVDCIGMTFDGGEVGEECVMLICG